MSQTEIQTVMQEASEVVQHPPAPLRVLHIEDNPSDKSLMQEHLLAILPSVEFDDAVRLADVTQLRAAAADCALLDLSLPDAAGLDALLALREISDRLPIIVLTGFDDMEVGLAAVREGADDYLVKNHVDSYTLERAVQYAIERRNLLLQLDTTITDSIVKDASNVTVGAAMTAAFQLLQQTLVDDEPASGRPDASSRGPAAQSDQRSRDLELQLERDSADWVDDDLPVENTAGEPLDADAALAELHGIVLHEQLRNATLVRILHLAKRALPELVEASITLLDGDRAETIVFTGPLALDLDERQFDVGYGPCTDAALTIDAVVVVTAEENAYPHFSLGARRAGITHSVSVALPCAERVVGSLNLYIASDLPVDPDTVLLAQSFAGCAAVVVADARGQRDVPERAAQIRETQRTRGIIEQAKGVLMMRNHCSSREAFETLTRVSQRSNREIGEIAATLVAMVPRDAPRT